MVIVNLALYLIVGLFSAMPRSGEPVERFRPLLDYLEAVGSLKVAPEVKSV